MYLVLAPGPTLLFPTLVLVYYFDGFGSCRLFSYDNTCTVVLRNVMLKVSDIAFQLNIFNVITPLIYVSEYKGANTFNGCS